MSDQHLTLLYIKLPFPFPDHLDSGSFAPTVLQLSVLIFITVLQLSVLIFITVLQLSEEKFSSVGNRCCLAKVCCLLLVVCCL